jgi:hypothetical protein
MRDHGPGSGENLADWLQEVAKRPWDSVSPSVNPVVITQESARKAGQRAPLARHIQRGRDLVALGALTIGWLQYYILDVMVQIASLPKVIVFVPLAVA